MINQSSILTDTFGRKHSYLRISLTEKCNLRCTYCMPADGVLLTPKNQLMTADEIFSIAEIFVNQGVTKIRLTGGEPLVRKDFSEISTQLAQLKVDLSLTTNGILIDKYLPVLKQNGIKSINLSLDTLQEEKFKTITLRNQFQKVKENLYLLINEGFNIKVNVVLIKGFNDNEIIDFIKLTQDLPITIRFIEFMPFSGNKWDTTKVVSYKEIVEQAETHFGINQIQKLPNEANFTARNFKVHHFKGNFGIISSITNPFCDSCNRIRLTADGKIKNCLFSNKENDLLTQFREGKSIEPIIAKTMQSKLQKRAGMNTHEEMNNPQNHFDNRSMIAIGG
jgi:molybdenum cofactor biosynthesis protein A